MPLAGRPMVEWSLAAFRASESVGPIVVACPRGQAEVVSRPGGSDQGPEEAESGHLIVVEGGATRSQSVFNALAAVETELVAIHDAARPLLTPELIEGVVLTLAGDPDAVGAIAATPVTDTIKQVEGGSTEQVEGSDANRVINPSRAVETTLDRGRLWAAQTPQVFRTEALRRALEAYRDDASAATDEAMLIEAAGGTVLIHPSPVENFKVTTQFDLRLAELLLADR